MISLRNFIFTLYFIYNFITIANKKEKSLSINKKVEMDLKKVLNGIIMMKNKEIIILREDGTFKLKEKVINID